MEYLFGDLITFVPWIIFFYLRKDLRKEMLIMSIVSAPLAFFDLLYVPTYWRPVTLFNFPVGIEGLLLSFFIGGIAAVSYAEIFQKKLRKVLKYHKHFSFIVLLVIVPTAFLIKHFYPTNISISMYLALLIGIALCILIRKDLLKSSIAGSITFGVIYAVALIIWSNLFPLTNNWFVLQGLPRIFLFNAPVYEIIFGFLFGAYWGNLYELFFGYRLK